MFTLTYKLPNKPVKAATFFDYAVAVWWYNVVAKTLFALPDDAGWATLRCR